MYRFTLRQYASGDTVWKLLPQIGIFQEEGIEIQIPISKYRVSTNRKTSLLAAKKLILESKTNWIIPGDEKWIIDLNMLKKEFPHIKRSEWIKGKVSVAPEYETKSEKLLHTIVQRSTISLIILPDDMQAGYNLQTIPDAIQNSIKKFRNDNRELQNTCFLMMRFCETPAHNAIVNIIKENLNLHGIDCHRSDDRQYHDDLFYNVLTYIYGSGFGIAVYERIESEEFNPNISLEVGYMLALNKPVCFIKDKTLKTLHSDLIGKLYINFDPQVPEDTIPQKLNRWLMDKNIIC